MHKIEETLNLLNLNKQAQQIAAEWKAAANSEIKATEELLEKLTNPRGKRVTENEIERLKYIKRQINRGITRFQEQEKAIKNALKIEHDSFIQSVNIMSYSRKKQMLQVAVIDQKGRSHTRYLHRQGPGFIGKPIVQTGVFDYLEFQVDMDHFAKFAS